MNCPGCTHPMESASFDAVYGGKVEIDVCHHCNGLWFDRRESLQLTPGSTLRLFSALYQRRDEARAPLVADKRCPRCDGELTETFDLQRGTRFSYFRCAAHGRYTTFFQFLREKNLVRAPTLKQLNALKDRVKQVSCSNCGSPIVLAEGFSCAHCQAPVSILSEDSINQTLTELQTKEARRTTVDPMLAANLVMNQLQIDRQQRALDASPSFRWSVVDDDVTGDLIALGARALSRLVKGLFD